MKEVRNGIFWDSLSWSSKRQFKNYVILALLLMFAHSDHVTDSRNDFPRPIWNAAKTFISNYSPHHVKEISPPSPHYDNVLSIHIVDILVSMLLPSWSP